MCYEMSNRAGIRDTRRVHGGLVNLTCNHCWTRLGPAISKSPSYEQGVLVALSDPTSPPCLRPYLDRTYELGYCRYLFTQSPS
ncbi:unnamed protein product [Rhizoctonia solani]|uniref:Uncharacterized protein n=1 Tax=Rhizoctonia solani TaxID=456999 RepID=A0A8H3A9C7_9AGAM|nr:unnamed protein product [Rhizoctonia solani]